MGYFIEGRAHSNYPWNYITQGNLPWSTSSRNSVLGLDIDGSSYTSGDREYVYTEVSFSNDPGTLSEYMEYRITWTSNRYCSFTTPTGSPTSTPTAMSPTLPECEDLSSYIQFGEVEVYGLLELKTPLPTLEHPGDYVDSILANSQSIKVVGGYSTSYSYDRYSFIKNTNKGWIEMNEASDVPGMLELVFRLFLVWCH